MSVTVYKYPFEIAGEVVIPMPFGAKILRVECQAGQPCMWALVDADRVIETRRFLVRGTGHDIPRNPAEIEHIATFQQGPFVWHMFE
jgi:hypothetical protein